ncbi:MAG: cell envelope integrity protein TolA [Pseudomonadota bacterium]
MRTGFVISMLLHLSLLGWAVGSILATEPLDVPAVPVIEARLVTVGEFTNLRKGDPNSRKMDLEPDEEAPKTPADKAAKKPPLPKAPPPPAAEPPPPDPIEEKLKAEKEKAAQEEAKRKTAEAERLRKEKARKKAEAEKRKAEEAAKKKAEEAKKKAEAEKKKKAAEAKKKKLAEKKRREKKEAERKRKLAEEKARKAKKKFDPDAIRQALLDKTPEKRGAQAPTRAGERDGQGDQLTAREQDLIVSRIAQQIGRCWNLPGAGGGIRVPVVVLRWTMARDGSLQGAPIVVRNPGGTLARQAEEAAKRSIYCVQRFDLPEKYYKSWRVVEFAFDASSMISGRY